MHHIDRRSILRAGAAGLASLALPGLVAGGEPGRRRRNVLFLAVDDLNDWIGCYGGHPGVHTPHIDRLAAGGVTFERAYCPAPLCNPCRTATLTGIRPSRSGIYGNDTYFRDVGALRDVRTLPQHLSAGGYRSFGGGKVFHKAGGWFSDPASWTDQYSTASSTPRPPRKLSGMDWSGLGAYRQDHFDWGPIDLPVEATGDWQTAAGAAEILARRHDAPFFLACGIFRPHLPWYAPREFFDRFPLGDVTLPTVPEDDLADVPPPGVRMAGPEVHERIVAAGKWREAVRAYLACTAFADACVGHVLDALERSPHRDDTVVVLWSDHGWHLGEKEHWAKFALWEEACRSPLIVRAPGLTPPGTRCARTVSLQDLYPTISSLCGLDAPPHVDGRDLTPLLRDPQRAWEHPALTTHRFNNHAVRSERWRYIRYADGSEELYDHDADPQEWHNLADRASLAPVKRALAAHMPRDNAPPRNER